MKAITRFIRLTIKNGRVYKDQTFPLTNQGITCILGPNGAGKSTIWDFFQTIFFGATPSGHKRNDLVRESGESKYEIEFEVGDDHYVISYGRKDRKWVHEIVKNGQNITPHLQTDAAKKAKELLGRTKPEFEGSVHLTQEGQHLLINGKPSEKNKYISNFFGIEDNYDIPAQAAKEEKEAVREKIAGLSGISHSHQLLSEELKTYPLVDIEPIQSALEEHKSKYVNLESSKAELAEELRQTQNYYDLYQSVEIFDNAEALRAEVVGKIQALNAEIAKAEAIKQANAQAERSNQVAHTVQDSLGKILEQHPMIESFDLSYLRELYDLREKGRVLKPYREELETLPEIEDFDITPTVEHVNKLKADLMVQRNKVHAIQVGKCELCGTEMEHHNLEDERQKMYVMQRDIAMFEEEIKLLQQRSKIAQRRKQLLEIIGPTPEWTPEHEEDYLDKEDLAKVKRRYDQLQERLANFELQPLEPEIDVSGHVKEVEEQTSLLARIDDYRRAQAALNGFLPKQSVADLQASLKDLTDEMVELGKKKEEYSRNLIQMQAQNAQHNRLQTQVADLEAKLSSIDELKQREAYWAAIEAAYGPRGIRIHQLEKIMDRVIQRLPYYTDSLFQEKGLTFSHKCEADKLEIFAHRTIKGQKKPIVHSVSSFSGGEKKRLAISLVLTLADCVASHKKTNLLILDEIDAHLEEIGRYRFVNELLPLLKEDYESIFVISHSADINQAAVYDQVWNIKKENHWSTVEMVPA